MPKRARAYWKGHLRLSLVSIPVEIYNAVESQNEISFRQIHKPSGRRINLEKVVQGTIRKRCANSSKTSSKARRSSLRRMPQRALAATSST